MRETMKTPARRISGLDGLRGLAILLVLSGHSIWAFAPETVPAALTALAGNAMFGVRLFFTLSGYLITHLLLKEKQQQGAVSLPQFYLRRALRILPLCYAYIIVLAIINKLAPLNISLTQMCAALSFTWNHYVAYIQNGSVAGDWYFGHLWTLASEQQFYLLWPLLFVFMRRKYLTRLAWAIVMLVPAIRIAGYFLTPAFRPTIGLTVNTAIDPIMIGCCFALLNDRLKNTIATYAAKFIPILLIFPLICSPLLALYLQGRYTLTVGLTLDASCVGCLIILIHLKRAPDYLSNFLGSQALQWLGRFSYSIYIWQQLFLTRLNPTISGTPPWCFVAILITSCASYYCIERPFLRRKDVFMKRHQRPADRVAGPAEPESGNECQPV